MTKLSSQVKVVGLSKNKILAVIFIFGTLLGIALFFGIFSSDEDSVTPHELESKNDTYQNNNTQDSINKILNEANKTKDKSAASKVSAQAMSGVVNSAAIQEVPPILFQQTKSEEAQSTSEAKAKIQFDKKQIDNKYTSLSSRSLVYSNKPTGVVNIQRIEDETENAEEANHVIVNTHEASLSVENKGLSAENKDNAMVADDARSISRKTINKSTLKQMPNSNEKRNNYLDANMETPKSPYEVKAGSVIPATMINGLNSDLPGQVIAQVRDNIYDTVSRRYLLIPQGARLVGLYDSNILYGQERILVAWNRLIYPNGSSINLKAMPGTDLEGYSGFHDIVDNKYWKIFGTSFIMGVLTGAMQYSQNNTNANVQVGGLGITSNSNPTVGQTLAGSLGQQLGQTGLMLAQKNLNIQPTLIVKPNYPFNIMITADMILRPYKLAKHK